MQDRDVLEDDAVVVVGPVVIVGVGLLHAEVEDQSVAAVGALTNEERLQWNKLN